MKYIQVLYIKKTIVVFLTVLFLFLLTSCTKIPTGMPSREDVLKDYSKTSSSKTDYTEILIERNISAYQFSLPESYQNEFSFTYNDGHVYSDTFLHTMEKENRTVLCYEDNEIPFGSWDTVVSDSLDVLASSLNTVYQFYPTQQSISNKEQWINGDNIEMLKVEGILKGHKEAAGSGEEVGGTVEQQYIALYYVTDETDDQKPVIRFFIAFVNDNYNRINRDISIICTSLEKITVNVNN